MARKVLKYYLFDENKKPLYIDKHSGLMLTGNDNLQKPDGQPVDLEYAPDGWKDTLLKYGRNMKYWGLFRGMTVPMNLHGDAYEIATRRMWAANGGIAQTTYLGMQKLDRVSIPYTYKNWLLSELDFNKYRQTKTGASIQALEGGLAKFLKANDDQVYDIPIDTDGEMVQLRHDGIPLDNVAQFQIDNGSTLGDPTALIRNHIVGVQLVQKEISNVGETQALPRTKVSNSNPLIKNTGAYIFKPSIACALNCEWDFTIDMEFEPPPGLNPSIDMFCVLRAIKSDGNIRQQLVLQQRHNIGFGFTGVRLAKGAGVLNVFPGDEVYFYTFVTVEGSTGDAQMSWNYGGNMHLKMSYEFQFPTTTINGLLPLTLANRLLDKMTGSTGIYSIRSSFLTARNLDTFLTSGDALRGLNNSVIHTSFSDFFRSFFCQYGIGLGIIGDQLVIEKLEYFFQNNITILDIGELTDWDITVAEDMTYSSGKFGFDKQEYEGLNGKFEFNNGQRWKFPVNSFKRELDMISPYRADPIGIELYRINFDGKTSTDNDSDNNTFMINVKKGLDVAKFTAVKNTAQAGTLPMDMSFDTRTPGFFESTDNTSFKFTGSAPQYTNIGIFFKVTKTESSNVLVQLLRNGVDVVASKNAIANGAADNISALGVVLQPGDVLKIAFTNTSGTTTATINQASMTVFFSNVYVYDLYRDPTAVITGVPHPEGIYNTTYSPKQAMLRLGSYLHSILDRMDNGQITMTDADKNADLVVNGVKERDAITVGNLPPKLFLPYYITGKTQVNIFYKEIMDTNPYGLIRFTIKGVEFFGFMNDGGIKPATNDAQEWIMISAPGNDFSKIKRGQTLM